MWLFEVETKAADIRCVGLHLGSDSAEVEPVGLPLGIKSSMCGLESKLQSCLLFSGVSVSVVPDHRKKSPQRCVRLPNADRQFPPYA